MPDPQSTDPWLLLLEGVLDWPFLLFIIIIFSSLFFRQQLGVLLSRGVLRSTGAQATSDCATSPRRLIRRSTRCEKSLRH